MLSRVVNYKQKKRDKAFMHNVIAYIYLWAQKSRNYVVVRDLVVTLRRSQCGVQQQQEEGSHHHTDMRPHTTDHSFISREESYTTRTRTLKVFIVFIIHVSKLSNLLSTFSAMWVSSLSLFFLGLSPAAAGCPFLANQKQTPLTSQESVDAEAITAYRRALTDIDFSAVQVDLVELFHTSQDWWPSDFDNYGPFFVRLAWHCSGSYRYYD